MKCFRSGVATLHHGFEEAEKLLKECRSRLAAVLACQPGEIVFTSGATESNNMVLFSLLHKKQDRRILLSGIEHPSVYQPAQTLRNLGFEVVEISADRTGRLDPGDLIAALDERTVLAAVMLVNNETGRVQPLEEISAGMNNSPEGKARDMITASLCVSSMKRRVMLIYHIQYIVKSPASTSGLLWMMC